MRKFCEYFLILPYFPLFSRPLDGGNGVRGNYISSDFATIFAEKLSTASPPYTLRLISAAPLPIKPTFPPHEKRRETALDPFVLGCQRRVAPRTQTKYPLRIVIN